MAHQVCECMCVCMHVHMCEYASIHAWVCGVCVHAFVYMCMGVHVSGI